MIFDKKLVYDWAGGNEWLFRTINSLSGNPTYDSFMVFLSNVADHHNFPYYLSAICIYACIDFIVRQITKRAGSGKSLVVWIGILCVFAASYAVDGEIVRHIKEYFSFPRPYVALDDVHMLGTGKEGDDYHSFPSGHVSFITVVVCSLWPVLSGNMPKMAAFLIFGVAWSRVAMGMHFPVDVLGGFLIAGIVTTVLRWVIYTLFHKLFGWKC